MKSRSVRGVDAAVVLVARGELDLDGFARIHHELGKHRVGVAHTAVILLRRGVERIASGFGDRIEIEVEALLAPLDADREPGFPAGHFTDVSGRDEIVGDEIGRAFGIAAREDPIGKARLVVVRIAGLREKAVGKRVVPVALARAGGAARTAVRTA
jgi:hypothetical protein